MLEQYPEGLVACVPWHLTLMRWPALLRLMLEILHDFEHPHGSPATPNFNIAWMQGLKPWPVRMHKILHDPMVVQR